MKIKLFKRTTSKLVFTGLMLNLIATSLPLRAISFPEPRSAQEAAEQQRELQRWEKEQQKIMQRADIDVKIALLKKHLKQMKKVRILMITAIGTMGVTIGLWGTGLIGSIALGIAATGIGTVPVAVTAIVGGGTALTLTISVLTISTKAVTLAILFAGIASGIGPVIALAPGLFAAVSGLSDISKVKKTVKELEQIERTSPGTLTKEHKTVLEQLKNHFKDPIIRGISQAIEEKKVLDTTVQSVLQNNPQLKLSLGKKASKRLKKHILWNWQLNNYKKALASLAKSRLKKFHPKYLPIAIRKKITKAQLKKLYKKHSILKNLQQPIDEFTNKIKRLQVGFAKIK